MLGCQALWVGGQDSAGQQWQDHGDRWLKARLQSNSTALLDLNNFHGRVEPHVLVDPLT